MMDALLFSTLDAVTDPANRFGYNENRDANIMAGGEPPAQCGQWFLSIHEGDVSNESVENLDEYFTVILTLTARISIPIDVVGNKLLAVKVARDQAQKTGFNARREALRAFLNKNWGIVAKANQYLAQWAIGVEEVYGFCESPIVRRLERQHLVGPEWFSQAPPKEGQRSWTPETGLVGDVTMERIRRLQPVEEFY